MVYGVTASGEAVGRAPAEVVWIFRRDRRRWLTDWRRGECSREFLYGLTSLSERYRVGLVEDESRNPFRRPWYLVERLVARRIGMGFALDIALGNLAALNRARVLISTVDTCGLPLALLKRCGLLKARLVYITQGLPDRVAAYGAERRLARFYRRLLLGVDELVALSHGAAMALAEWLGVATDRVVVLPFGTDDEFWRSPAGNGEVGGYVFSIGSDSGRDYGTLLAASGELPVHIVTRQPLRLDDRSSVRRTTDHSPTELRELYSTARFVVIPLHDRSQPSGQSAALQAMACGRTVVMTRTRGWWGEAFLRDGDNCVLVPPGDPTALAAAMRALWSDAGACARIGAAARATVSKHFSEARMASALDVLIARQLDAARGGPPRPERDA